MDTSPSCSWAWSDMGVVTKPKEPPPVGLHCEGREAGMGAQVLLAPGRGTPGPESEPIPHGPRFQDEAGLAQAALRL